MTGERESGSVQEAVAGTFAALVLPDKRRRPQKREIPAPGCTEVA